MPTDATPIAPERRAWEFVLQSIEAELLTGELRPGDHLPPERTLAADLGVGRSSVREALRVLEVLGLVRTATGSGPGAGAIIVATPSGGMSALMRLQVAARGFAVADVVKTRLLLETSIAAELASSLGELADSALANRPQAASRQLPRNAPPEVAQSAESGAYRERSANPYPAPDAAPNPTPAPAPAPGLDPLAPATQLLNAMDSLDLTEAEFLALDAQFHLALAEASGNQIVAAMMAGLRNSIESYVLAAVPNLPSWTVTSARLRAEHRGILSAISAGEATDAAARVRAHISGYYAESRLTMPATDATEYPESPEAPEREEASNG